MATNLDIITRALKKLHVLPAGQAPTAVQASAAMDALQGVIVEIIGMGTLGRLYDVLATADCTAMEWTRIRASAGVVVTLPPTITQAIASSWPWDASGPDYGWYYRDGWGVYPRPPFNFAPIVVIDSAGEETASIYVANKGTWVTVNGLGQQDDFPFSQDMENGFAALLAERLTDDYSAILGVQTAKQAAWCRVSLTHRFGSVGRSAGSLSNYL